MSTEVLEEDVMLDALDHVAVVVRDVSAAANWYASKLRCRVTYQDATWALLEFKNLQLALVAADQHPPHFAVLRTDAGKFGDLVTHRDGTRSCYIHDPFGNAIEMLLRSDP